MQSWGVNRVYILQESNRPAYIVFEPFDAGDPVMAQIKLLEVF